MLALPPALAALGAWRQFIVYVAVLSRTRPGKTDKFPVDWRTGRVTVAGSGGAHDPAIWLSFDEAAAHAARLGGAHGVGFVLTAADPFWFIDVDACLVAGAWSAIAQELVARFTGAAWEVSLSGAGLHGIGQGIAPETRRIKYGDKFDLYTEGRFVALTGTNAVGDAETDHTAALFQLVADYLTPDAATTPSEWTTVPCEGWRGPQDDVQLIERAMRSASAAAAFGGRASFRDLWEADAAKLALAFPDPQRPYDDSRADSALAQHLAFWTGKNCERIRQIMARSQLAREKWNRDDYLPRTILGVVSRQVDVLQDRELALPSTPQPLSANVPTPVAVSGQTLLFPELQVQLFQGCVYVRNVHRILVPGGDLLRPEQFRAMYGGYSFVMDPNNERTVRNAFEAFTESQCLRTPRVDEACFRPELPPLAIIEESGRRLVNQWWPIDTPRKEGDPAPFLEHLAKLLPDERDREQLLAYFAALVQYPGVKFQWAPLIQGAEGNGKTVLVEALTYCVGQRYTHLPNTSDLGGNGLKFTGWLQGKLFVCLEEIHTSDKRDVTQALLALITNRRIEVQAKGVDQFTGDNRANVLALTNFKDAVPKDRNGRRWAIYYTAQQTADEIITSGMGGDYFPKLWAWLRADGFAIVNNYLRNYAIPDALNPAGGCHRAPRTSSEDEAVGVSLGVIEQEVLEALEQEQPGFAGGWISSTMLDRLLIRQRLDKRMSPRKRHDLIVGMGYVHHPNLPGGRVNAAVQPDGTKPRLYIKKGSLLGNFATVRAVEDAYQRAQTNAMSAPAKFGPTGT